MEAFPNAKVILTKRDPAKWHKSVKETIYYNRSMAKQPLVMAMLRWLGFVACHDFVVRSKKGT